MSKKGFLFQRTVKKNAFKKSSFCDEYSCVSVRTEENAVRVRDTKDVSKKTLSFTRTEWNDFIKGVKNGEFDLM